jgi:hypothetical protein
MKRIPDSKRQTFHEMLELVESATIDGVLIYELSQVARTF